MVTLLTVMTFGMVMSLVVVMVRAEPRPAPAKQRGVRIRMTR
jgi:hypothetical protein